MFPFKAGLRRRPRVRRQQPRRLFVVGDRGLERESSHKRLDQDKLDEELVQDRLDEELVQPRLDGNVHRCSLALLLH
jgi:hypothetical protein